MKYFLWFLIVALLFAHQDNFLWDNSTLLFDFMPIGLAYHAMLSMAAGGMWYFAVKCCWPEGLDGDLPSSETPQGESSCNN